MNKIEAKQQMSRDVVTANMGRLGFLFAKNRAIFAKGIDNEHDFFNTFCDQDTEAYMQDIIKLCGVYDENMGNAEEQA